MDVLILLIAILLGAVVAVVGRAFAGVQRENDQSELRAEINRIDLLAKLEQDPEPQHIDLHRYQQDQWSSSEAYSPWRDIVQAALEELHSDGTTDIVIAIHLDRGGQKPPDTRPTDRPSRTSGRSEIRVVITRQGVVESGS